MKIAVLGGGGAMGGLLGGTLAKGGHDVTLVDVSREAVEILQREGLVIEDRSGRTEKIAIHASADPVAVRDADLVLILVKSYHTRAAVTSIAAHLKPHAAVLSLQNGWGNAPAIAAVVGQERTMVGVSYHSATLVAPGRVRHAGEGMTFIGELNGTDGRRLEEVGACLRAAGLAVGTTASVVREIWSKLALNACTLPTSALLRFAAGQLIDHDETLELMRALLREVVAVASAQKIPLDQEERWEAIVGLLGRAAGAKASMLQDVERRRRTEIDVINGAVVAAGREHGIPTPHNETMVWLIKSLECGY